jgi:hypothetical protein
VEWKEDEVEAGEEKERERKKVERSGRTSKARFRISRSQLAPLLRIQPSLSQSQLRPAVLACPRIPSSSQRTGLPSRLTDRRKSRALLDWLRTLGASGGEEARRSGKHSWKAENSTQATTRRKESCILRRLRSLPPFSLQFDEQLKGVHLFRVPLLLATQEL